MSSHAATLRRPTLEWFAVTLLCVLLTLVAAVEGWLWRIDQTLYDGVLSTWTRPASDDVVIISIDDASLSSIGRWPWSRRVHAALIDVAREAGAHYGGVLYVDSLSTADGPVPTYLDLLRVTTQTIVQGINDGMRKQP